MTELYIKKDTARSLDQLESLIYVANMIFGNGKNSESSGPVKQIGSIDEATAFARMLNG